MKNNSIAAIMCLFCATSLLAQNSAYSHWEQQARSRAAPWSSYTSAATAAHRQNYVSLYLNGQKLASFNDFGTCNSKKTELKNLVNSVLPKTSGGSGTSSGGSTMTELERVAAANGVDVRGVRRQIENDLNKAIAESRARQRQELTSKINNACSCRSESNPNYKPNVKANDFGSDLFPQSNETETVAASPFDNERTQFENILDTDVPSARTPKPNTNTASPSVNLDFGDMGKYIDPNATPRLFENTVKVEELSKEGIEDYKKSIEEASKARAEMIASLLSEKEMLEQKRKSASLYELAFIDAEIKSLDERIIRLEKWSQEKIESAIKKNQELYAAKKEQYSNNVPWEDIYASINNPQRLTTITNQLVALNQGSMPNFAAETADKYMFEDKQKGIYFEVQKDGSAIFCLKESKISGNINVSIPLFKTDDPIDVTKIKPSQTLNAGDNISTKGSNSQKLDNPSIDVDVDVKYKKDLDNIENLCNRIDENKNEKKLMDYMKAKAEAKGSLANFELINMEIGYDGAAIKTSDKFEAVGGSINGSIGSGVSGEMKGNLASYDFTLSYVQAPKLNDDSENRTFEIKQSEVSLKVGLAAGASMKANYSADKIKGELSGLIKAGAGWENHNTTANLNYWNDRVQDSTVKGLFGY